MAEKDKGVELKRYAPAAARDTAGVYVWICQLCCEVILTFKSACVCAYVCD